MRKLSILSTFFDFIKNGILVSLKLYYRNWFFFSFFLLKANFNEFSKTWNSPNNFQLKTTNSKLKFPHCEKVPEKGFCYNERFHGNKQWSEKIKLKTAYFKLMILMATGKGLKFHALFHLYLFFGTIFINSFGISLQNVTIIFPQKGEKPSQPFEPLSGISFIIMQFNQLQTFYCWIEIWRFLFFAIVLNLIWRQNDQMLTFVHLTNFCWPEKADCLTQSLRPLWCHSK